MNELLRNRKEIENPEKLLIQLTAAVLEPGENRMYTVFLKLCTRYPFVMLCVYNYLLGYPADERCGDSRVAHLITQIEAGGFSAIGQRGKLVSIVCKHWKGGGNFHLDRSNLDAYLDFDRTLADIDFYRFMDKFDVEFKSEPRFPEKVVETAMNELQSFAYLLESEIEDSLNARKFVRSYLKSLIHPGLETGEVLEDFVESMFNYSKKEWIGLVNFLNALETFSQHVSTKYPTLRNLNIFNEFIQYFEDYIPELFSNLEKHLKKNNLELELVSGTKKYYRLRRNKH
jgi:hypothetical protein